jgi:hypothetical protein
MMTAATVCAVAQQLPDSVNAILSNDALLELLSSPTPQPRETPDTLHITPKPAITVPVAPRNHRERRETLAEQLRRWKPEELVADTTLDVSYMSVPVRMKLPAVFSRVSITLPEQAYNPLTDSYPGASPAWSAWADGAVARDSRFRLMQQQWMLKHPELVPYNTATMAEPPREFIMSVDPATAQITVQEFDTSASTLKNANQIEANISRINWLHTFDGTVQFSQAYLSPNWYQGGNSNLNAIANILYNVKLNPAFHPNLIFEMTASYKLGANNAPDDSVHQYNISEDLFQVNANFGVRAAKRWFYSVTGQFKTQLLNNYKKNSNDLAAAFLSPAELNLGLGMTYTYENARKTVDFKASIAPGSYNLKTCTNPNIDPTQFGIDAGKTSVSQYGSSAELTLRWKMAWNIEYFSRLFLFTNYSYMQGDWENTVTFNISRFLSTKIYAHLRYDSSTPRTEGTRWHQWQLKEILSIGFAYKFQRG